jgi:hypothetical protein
MIENFANFCRIDLQLKERIVESHVPKKIKSFLQFLGKDPLDANAEDLRGFLLRFRDKSSYTYANYLKALKVFFRDYLGMPQVVSTFRFPRHEIVLVLDFKEDFGGFASKIGVIGFAPYSAYASYAGNKGVAFPSQRTLARMLGISIKTIIKYNKKL